MQKNRANFILLTVALVPMWIMAKEKSVRQVSIESQTPGHSLLNVVEEFCKGMIAGSCATLGMQTLANSLGLNEKIVKHDIEKHGVCVDKMQGQLIASISLLATAIYDRVTVGTPIKILASRSFGSIAGYIVTARLSKFVYTSFFDNQ